MNRSGLLAVILARCPARCGCCDVLAMEKACRPHSGVRTKRTRAKTTAARSQAAAPAPRFFATPAAFRTWLTANHRTRRELLVGFRVIASGRRSITWSEAVDEALCFGWVDGVRHRIDAASYTVRFTPRRAGSTWSAVNIARIARLERDGRLAAAGRAAFAVRTEHRSRQYSYERTTAAELAAELAAVLRADAAAWAFHCAQAPSYQRKVVHWIMAAAGADTRARRLRQLLAAYGKGRRL